MCILQDSTDEFLNNVAGLDRLVVDAMHAEDTRSRAIVRPQGVLVILKAMHVTGQADPQDMISLRIRLDPLRVISTREKDIDAIFQIHKGIESGNGPDSPAAFLTQIIGLHLD